MNLKKILEKDLNKSFTISFIKVQLATFPSEVSVDQNLEESQGLFKPLRPYYALLPKLHNNLFRR